MSAIVPDRSPEAAEREAIAAICLLAALADGGLDDAERERLRTALSSASGGDSALAGVYERVVLGRTTAAAEAQRLRTAESRREAFAMAVGVCDADGATSRAERVFLDELRALLGVGAATSERVVANADRLVATPLDTDPVDLLDEDTAASPPPETLADPQEREQAIDEMIRRSAMLSAALELLPQTLATVAILPLQARLVYRIGKSHGYDLDSGHVKEFIAAAGVGLTAQVVEGYARRLVGGLLRRTLGRAAGGLAGAATGAATTFATTWALGQLARRYYAGGRTMSLEQVRSVFAEQVERGRRQYASVAPEIESRARLLEPSAIAKALAV